MFSRPFLAIAIFYALIIIILRPWIPLPASDFHTQSQPEIPIISPLSRHFVDVISKTTEKPYDLLLASVVFGSGMSPLDPDLKDKYKKVGLAHLLVASGTQVSILIGFSLMIVRNLRIPLNIGIVFVSIFNIIFTIMTGCGPSMIRAAVMGEISLLGLLLDRRGDIYNSLGIAALILMIIDPLIIFNIGFQLTFAATWALVYFCPILEKKGIPSIVSVSLAPILVTMPIILYNFNQFSVVALLVNVLVVPWIETLTVIGFISTILGSFFLPIAEILNYSLSLILKILNGIVYVFCDISFSAVYLQQPGFLFVLSYYAGLIYIAEVWKRGEKFVFDKRKGVTLLLLFISLFVWNGAFGDSEKFPKDKLQISVIDVKQGDSIFIRSPSGKTMLIDGGPCFKNGDAGRYFVLPFLYKQGINKIDVVVLTHPHDDHVGGLPSILKELQVGLILDSGQLHTSKRYMSFLEYVERKNISYMLARRGVKIDLGGGVLGEILHPTDKFIEESALNNNSVVMRLTYGKFAMMLTGDLEKEGEDQVLATFSNELIKSDVLKIGHHGSNTASSYDFLKVVDPSIAIISVGKKNQFHHPHKSTLSKLEERRISVFRTDLSGTVTVLTDGRGFWIR
ncbi:DNA internalization-related competence protein ComEC/Rec2 [candidate division WOR-1 bacterium RIFOXYA2_FULL_36_21]|uniref:DNA internalization-related competence protein ComEC/Rec2 n=1 Tax=candidate division WOR-1 bacterium RIFOXYB2_FULL_36_35 TaxID=1802578 RepID=A0A1F4S1A8_UNCSA|nr:MAG: DNA internalization-related competence protein ComEC/Rec2 [candidate division WOR-1 bacterium RIFOXYA2_FULL_36_21]OGC14169.1 MAG: DNA internalization-related competence protein ComEC/Rec2 [candidate division WOR-1 bacterium RIFOXYB2_FULL_36_35]OGC15391.1 MAG: DNA internalization-related competence protein ComEC/Rec2 [candidate division WOR-1 bacterium RIFOXYA12_FULL_36_13]